MSRFDYDIQEKHDFYAEMHSSERCANCGRTDQILSDVITCDGRSELLCDECVEEDRKLEAEAIALVDTGLLCEEREQLIEKAQSTTELVNRVKYHDMTCAACSSVRKPAESAVQPVSAERSAA